jgi:hypothetical protein
VFVYDAAGEREAEAIAARNLECTPASIASAWFEEPPLSVLPPGSLPLRQLDCEHGLVN